MIYDLDAEHFFGLPEQIKEGVQRYLIKHGVNPDHVQRFTIDMDMKGLSVTRYVLGPLGHAVIDGETMQPEFWTEWIPFNKDEKPPHPTLLSYMIPSARPPAGLGDAGTNDKHQKIVLP